MRALVVYESMYGNTHAVATEIAAGLGATHEVTLVPVTRATREMATTADLIVAGGPTHMHGMSTVASRRTAAETARKPGSGLTMDPDADGPGLRGWLEAGCPRRRARRVLRHPAQRDSRLTGRASRGIARRLTERGCRLLLPPESFLVSKKNTLLPGEAARARAWGARVGETARAARRCRSHKRKARNSRRSKGPRLPRSRVSSGPRPSDPATRLEENSRRRKARWLR